MYRENSSSPTRQLLCAAAAVLIGASLVGATAASAQQPAGASVIEHKEVGRNYAGVPIDEISVTRSVSYRDLDLTSLSGVATLKGRIADTARQACMQLDALASPEGEWDDEDCIKSAIDDGIAHAEMAIAGAGGKYSLQ